MKGRLEVSHYILNFRCLAPLRLNFILQAKFDRELQEAEDIMHSQLRLATLPVNEGVLLRVKSRSPGNFTFKQIICTENNNNGY